MTAPIARDRAVSADAAAATGRNPACPCGGCLGTMKGARPQWPNRAKPLLALAQRRGKDRELLDYGWRPSWVDHPYRVRAEDGREVYVAEPYGITDEAVADLATLAAAGWQVAITASKALHYPGHTIAIRITEEKN